MFERLRKDDSVSRHFVTWSVRTPLTSRLYRSDISLFDVRYANWIHLRRLWRGQEQEDSDKNVSYFSDVRKTRVYTHDCWHSFDDKVYAIETCFCVCTLTVSWICALRRDSRVPSYSCAFTIDFCASCASSWDNMARRSHRQLCALFFLLLFADILKGKSPLWNLNVQRENKACHVWRANKVCHKKFRIA